MLKLLSEKKEPKVLVIGLDGVPYTLLMEYMRQGHLPEFKRILGKDFKLHQMDASIPDVSSTSWASFMTGANPAEHGIYGFMDLCPNSYQMYFPNSRDVQAPTIWNIIEKNTNGKASALHDEFMDKLNRSMRSIILNIPQTYPASAMNGILTAGFVCPDLRLGTYPGTAYEYLKSIGYLPDVDSDKAKDKKDEFFKEIFLALEKRLIAYERFLKGESWDLFVGVITETDRLHHFFFDAALDTDHPYHSAFVSFYREMDKTVGKLHDIFMEMTGGDGLFMTMSDHGFTVLKQEFNINSWLRKEGFLKLDAQRKYYEQVDAGTKAFAMDPGRIYINVEGKYPRGSVKESEKAGIVTELKERLNAVTDGEGKPVIKKVYENSVIYRGPLAEKGPDLVCIAHDGFDLKATLKKDEVFGKGHFSGMHTCYDAHCILPGDLEISQRLHIEHLARLMMEHFTGKDKNSKRGTYGSFNRS